MKSKLLLLSLLCFGLTTVEAAQNRHVHGSEQAVKVQPAMKSAMAPGYCEFEIINDSFDNLTVTGQFDDGTYLNPFNIYRNESPHYVSLYYAGYCHRSMMLWIDTFRGYRVYSGYAPVDHTIRIVAPSLSEQPKALTVKK